MWPGGFDGDKADNFYTVYGQIFEKMDKEEEEEEEYGTEHIQPPGFGDQGTHPEDVVLFYQHWSGFTTKKPFAYKDKYKPQDADERRVKRIIDKENKKERVRERKKFNETVKTLIEYVKKRDTRYQLYIQKLDEEKEEKERIEAEKKAKMRAAKRKEMDAYKEDIRIHNEKMEAEAEESEEEEDDIFFCELCDKKFKKEGQLKNHFNTKKHKRAEKEFLENTPLDEEAQKKQEDEEQKRKDEEDEAYKIQNEKIREEYGNVKEKTKTRGVNQYEDPEADTDEIGEKKPEPEKEEYISAAKLKKMRKKGKKGEPEVNPEAQPKKPEPTKGKRRKHKNRGKNKKQAEEEEEVPVEDNASGDENQDESHKPADSDDEKQDINDDKPNAKDGDDHQNSKGDGLLEKKDEGSDSESDEMEGLSKAQIKKMKKQKKKMKAQMEAL